MVAPALNFLLRILQTGKPMQVQATVADLPARLAANVSWASFPGWIKCNLTLVRFDEKNMASLVSSGPSSKTIRAGSPRCCAKRFSSRIRH